MYEDYNINTVTLGKWASYSLLTDPKHFVFALSRYKFCSKVLSNKGNILDIGCGDGTGMYILAQNKQLVVGIDNDNIITDNLDKINKPNIDFIRHDILQGPVPHGELFEAAVAIDVIEHISGIDEDVFIENIQKSLDVDGIVIIGTPNKTAEKYASPQSKDYHINLYTQDRLNELMCRHFYNVINFGMNDEVVHTGFGPMSHYLFSIGISKI